MRDTDEVADSLQSASRCLEVLLLFDEQRQQLRVTDIAVLLGCSTASAQRTVQTLVDLQFLQKDVNTRSYRLGPSVLRLARAWQQTASLANIAKPALEELAEQTRLTSTFAVPDHAHMRVIISIDGSEGPLRAYPMSGELYPAHAGAISKVYYAQLPASMRAHFVSNRPMARYTALTPTDPGTIESEFERIRADGFCLSHGEYDREVTSLAAPVLVGKEAIGSISVSTRGQLSATTRLIDQILSAARRVGMLLSRR